MSPEQRGQYIAQSDNPAAAVGDYFKWAEANPGLAGTTALPNDKPKTPAKKAGKFGNVPAVKNKPGSNRIKDALKGKGKKGR